MEHFQREILERLAVGRAPGRPSIPVLAVPFLAADFNWPIRWARRPRIAFRSLNQVMVLADPAVARKRTVEHAIQYLSNSGGELLDVARQDLAAIEAWRALVQSSRLEFDTRYRNDFLDGEGFRRFDEARERLLNLLELPGAGRAFAMTLWAMRLPYRAVRTLIERAHRRGPPAVTLGEVQVLEQAFRAWMDELRAEAIRRADTHPLWKHVSAGFNSGLTETGDRSVAIAASHFPGRLRRRD